MSNNAGILSRWRPPNVPKLTDKAADRVRNQFGGLNLRPERIHSQRLGRAHKSKMDTGKRVSKRDRHPDGEAGCPEREHLCPVVLRRMPIIHDRLACPTELPAECPSKVIFACSPILVTYEARLTKEKEGRNHSMNVHPGDGQHLASSTSMDSIVAYVRASDQVRA